MDDDHDVYISYIQTADPSGLKDKALEARYSAKRIKEKEMNGVAGDNGAEKAGASANASMMTSNMLQGGAVQSNLG